MTTLYLDWCPSIFMMPDSSSLDAFPGIGVFQPEIDCCPLGQSFPWVYKSIPDRIVITLRGSKVVHEVQTYCLNPECSGRLYDERAGVERPMIFTSSALRELVLPHMGYGLDVILDMGRRFKSDPKPGKSIQTEIQHEYGSQIPLATLYRHKDRYEALCMGVIAEHREK